MNTFSCPYSKAYCGAAESSIAMHPELRNNLIVEIKNRLFVTGSSCYYRFYAIDSDLDRVNNRYFFEVTFEDTTYVNAFIMNGTEYTTADDSLAVTSYSGYKF